MTRDIKPEVARLLACPKCKGDLSLPADSILCNTCGGKYKICNGIPLLYPKELDVEHMQAEELMAEMMTHVERTPENAISASEWKKSKAEFWDMVRCSIDAVPRAILNIGCGFDTSFDSFQRDGHLFINFDIVYCMLNRLQEENGAEACVGGDVKFLPFKDESFDYVAAIDLIHHECDNLRPLLSRFFDVLKPGGILFIEDPNSLAMFQLAKTLLLPRPIHRVLREAYHKVKRSGSKPARYEFPTNFRKVRRILEDVGFTDVCFYPNNAYPNVGAIRLGIYNALARWEWIRTYHNWHYMLSAVKS